MKYVVGIGNPGKKYEFTRHNVGFRTLDTLARINKLGWDARPEWQAWIAQYAEDVLLAKPDTFVNRTETSLATMPEADSNDYLVVSDDVNLVFGKLRFRAAGSSGGHHGLESVITALGSENFPRLRIGVGGERLPKDLAPYVLEKFSKTEEKELPKILEKASEICESWIRGGPDAAWSCLSRLQSNKQGSEE